MNVYTASDGTVLMLGQPFTGLNDTKYPSNWLQLAGPDDLAAAGITLSVVPDPVPPAAAPNTFVPAATFIGRFTDAEYSAIKGAAQSQLATGMPQLQRWIDIAEATGGVDIASDAAIQAEAALVTAGLLTSDRAAIVFAGP